MESTDYEYIKEDTRRNSHTRRRIHNVNWFNPFDFFQCKDTYVKVFFDKHPDGIPVSEIDLMVCHLNNDSTISYQNRFCLRKKNLRERIINEIEKLAVSKTTYYNMGINKKIISYVVPASGFLTSSEPKYNYNRNSTQFNNEQIVRIGGKYYSNNYCYYRNGTDYVRIKISKDWFNSENINCEPDERVYKNYMFCIRKNSIDIRYQQEIQVDYLSLHPSKALFDFVHSDNNCRCNCHKEKHGIQVLKNNPGYITKFELYYRSSQTDNKWVNHGIFTGCSNWYEPVKIPIDSVTVKEIRIVPITFHESWDKVTVYPIGRVEDKQAESSDIFIEYLFYIPDANQTNVKVRDNFFHPYKCKRQYYRDRFDENVQELLESRYYTKEQIDYDE